MSDSTVGRTESTLANFSRFCFIPHDAIRNDDALHECFALRDMDIRVRRDLGMDVQIVIRVNDSNRICQSDPVLESRGASLCEEPMSAMRCRDAVFKRLLVLCILRLQQMLLRYTP